MAVAAGPGWMGCAGVEARCGFLPAGPCLPDLHESGHVSSGALFIIINPRPTIYARTAILNDDYSLKRTLKVKFVTPDGVVSGAALLFFCERGDGGREGGIN